MRVEGPLEKWGMIQMVPKVLRDDTGIDMGSALESFYDASLPENFRRAGNIEVEWHDGDDTESLQGRLQREMYLDAGIEPPRNLWYARITADVQPV